MDKKIIQSGCEVEDTCANCDGFNENIFTFHVGPSKKRFMVHADIVSPHSRILRRLIEGAFKESIERYAELPEVDPATFGHFLAYAYFMSSCTSRNEKPTQPSSTQRTSISKFIELLLENGHKRFKCKSCHLTPELKFSLSFPQCSYCNQDEFRKDWKTQCVVLDCSANGEYIQGLCCEKCLKNMKIYARSGKLQEPGAAKLQLRLPGGRDKLQDFHFDIPLRVKDILEATEDFVPLPPLATASLLDTGRLAVFADIYEVKPLSQATLMTLYQKLTQESLDGESIATICELTDFVYNNTPNCHTRTSSESTHVLRRILSTFIATYREKFTDSRTFMELLFQGGELAGDIILATIRRGASSMKA